MKYFNLATSDTLYEKIMDLKEKWNKDQKDLYTISDVMKICINTIWENEINSLNKSLTNTSKS